MRIQKFSNVEEEVLLHTKQTCKKAVGRNAWCDFYRPPYSRSHWVYGHLCVFARNYATKLTRSCKREINRRNGIHAFFGRQWPNSVGHGVWNDIFAVFHSLVRFGYENSKFHPVVIDPKDSPCCRNEIDFRDFSGNKLEFLKDFSDCLYVFEKVVVGNSMLKADDVSLFRQWLSGYPRARNMLKFRDRWYKSYSLFANHYKFTNISKIVIIENKREN